MDAAVSPEQDNIWSLRQQLNCTKLITPVNIPANYTQFWKGCMSQYFRPLIQHKVISNDRPVHNITISEGLHTSGDNYDGICSQSVQENWNSKPRLRFLRYLIKAEIQTTNYKIKTLFTIQLHPNVLVTKHQHHLTPSNELWKLALQQIRRILFYLLINVNVEVTNQGIFLVTPGEINSNVNWLHPLIWFALGKLPIHPISIQHQKRACLTAPKWNYVSKGQDLDWCDNGNEGTLN